MVFWIALSLEAVILLTRILEKSEFEFEKIKEKKVA